MDQGLGAVRRQSLAALAAAAMLLLAARAAPVAAADPIRATPGGDAVSYCGRIQAAFTREDFASLEATAAAARALDVHLSSGKPELQVFYESLARRACTDRYVRLDEDTGRARTTTAEHWLGQMPKSAAARIANAMVWSQYAWAARGNGYADQVSQEQWAVFGDRIQHAAQFMRAVDPDGDAQAYLVLLELARDFSLARPQIDAIFQQARTHFPGYLGYYAEYASILLPKWFGQPGDIAAYLNSLLAAPGGDIGAMAYARAGERLAFELGSPGIYRETGLVWADLRRGFELRAKGDGMDKGGWISFCYYAVMANDRDTAREAYRHIERIDEWPDGGTHAFFLTVLPWIMDRG